MSGVTVHIAIDYKRQATSNIAEKLGSPSTEYR
jgi:hypothetical protein